MLYTITYQEKWVQNFELGTTFPLCIDDKAHADTFSVINNYIIIKYHYIITICPLDILPFGGFSLQYTQAWYTNI